MALRRTTPSKKRLWLVMTVKHDDDDDKAESSRTKEHLDSSWRRRRRRRRRRLPLNRRVLILIAWLTALAAFCAILWNAAQQRDDEKAAVLSIAASKRKRDVRRPLQPQPTITDKEHPQRRDDSTTLLAEENHNSDDLVTDFAMQHVESLKAAYQETNRLNVFYMRGLGYIWTQHGMVLVATLQQEQETLQVGRNVLQIHDVLQKNTHNADCALWTFWVRVAGPTEIFAGTARAVTAVAGKRCRWEFAFEIQQQEPLQPSSAEYEVDVKALLWNGQVAADPDHQCEILRDIRQFATALARYPNHTAFVGFKLYYPLTACCEVCARTTDCVYWSSPPLSIAVEAHQQGCELYYDDSSDDPEHAAVAATSQHDHHHGRRLSILHARNTKKDDDTGTGMAHGPPHKHPTAYFVGCGWSFWFTHDFACLDPAVDDAVPVYPSNKLTLQLPTTTENNNEQPRQPSLPLCRIDKDEELQDGPLPRGRWIRQPWPDDDTCPTPMQVDVNHSAMFDIMKFDGERPACWHRDDLSRVGTKCIEFCATERHHPWISSLHRETAWYGVWKNYDCEYRELTDAELQQCVDRKRIASIQVDGKSVAAFLRQYMDQRLQNIVFSSSSNQTAVTEDIHNVTQPLLQVTLTTFGLPHLLWHESNAAWRSFLSSLPPVQPDQEEVYWVTGFYYSSEREPHVHVGRSEQLTRLMKLALSKSGYRMINAFDLTAAFTFDTATQNDGLHIIGPPAKMIITNFLHYLCTGDV